MVYERIRPIDPPSFPFGSVLGTFYMMTVTFFRKRLSIHKLSENSYLDYDLIILAGPTWSYNPSGPVLAMLDRAGKRLFSGKKVIPLISCRGYWRAHFYGLRRLLQKSGAIVVNRIVFCHPSKEPWRTIGVFLKLAGKTPERMKLLKGRYPKYGHTRMQVDEAHEFGRMIGESLYSDADLSVLDFNTQRAMP